MSLVGEVYSVLIGFGLDIGSSLGSILIFFFGTACTVQVMDTRDIHTDHTHDMIMTQTVNNNWKMYNRITTDRNDLEISLNVFIRIKWCIADFKRIDIETFDIESLKRSILINICMIQKFDSKIVSYIIYYIIFIII